MLTVKMWKIILIILGVLYVLSPYDILPDFIIGWGWIDDLVIIGLLWRYLFMQKKKQEAFARYQQNASGGPDNAGPDASKDGTSRQNHKFQDPFTTLGLERGATDQQIKQAYRQLALKYHPDKVAHLGDEFKALAEKRFKEIQQAYEELKRS